MCDTTPISNDTMSSGMYDLRCPIPTAELAASAAGPPQSLGSRRASHDGDEEELDGECAQSADGELDGDGDGIPNALDCDCIDE